MIPTLSNNLSIRIKLILLKFMCKFLLPNDIWIGNQYSISAQKYILVIGFIDKNEKPHKITTLET